MTSSKKTRVFSGVQPTGKLHIGNYIGALSVWASRQEEFDGIYCVVDMHALTIPEKINPLQLKEKTWETVAIYLASGIDPQKSTVFIQSMVPQHGELSWYLTCMTPMGWLERMTQFKDKSSKQQSTGTGLFTYPVLQAADILLYDTEIVPVGEDQKQHIELTRDIATRFNNMYGTVFTLPDALIRKVGARIMALDDPSGKMSKSIGEVKANHSIGVIDSPAVITKAIKSAKTDSGSVVDFDNAGLGIRNLLTMHQVMTGWNDDQMRQHFDQKGYGFLKTEVAEAVCEGLRPVREKYHSLRNDHAYLRQVVIDGAEKAKSYAEEKMATVREALEINFDAPVLNRRVDLNAKPSLDM